MILKPSLHQIGDNTASTELGIDKAIGNDIVFGEGQYQPNTLERRSRLAHEMTHVVHQGTALKRKTTVGPSDENWIKQAAIIPGTIKDSRFLYTCLRYVICSGT